MNGPTTPQEVPSSPQLSGDPWLWWRSLMPVAPDMAYLDHAAVAPLPRPAADAIREFAEEASVHGDVLWPQWAAEVETLRSDFAEFLHCDAAEVALVPNTSFGINVVAEGLPWQEGDNIVIPAGEFPSNVFPWQNQQRRGVELRIVESPYGRPDIASILEAIDSRTRIVAASWVGYAQGHRLELEELVAGVHRRGVLFFLDAIQGLGVFPLDLAELPIDFLAADGHKWLLGPEGAGVLMVRAQHLDLLHCVPIGWNSVRAAHQFGRAELELKPDASRFEIGTQNMVGMRALRQSLGIFRRIKEVHGAAAIGNRVLDLADLLAERLRSAGATVDVASERESRSGIVTFSLPDIPPSRIRAAAAGQGVVVSCRGIGVRSAIHAYNDESDVNRLIEVLESF